MQRGRRLPRRRRVLTVERRLGGARGGSSCRESMTADSDHAERRAPAQKAARADRREHGHQ
jgi:hypothetical protein